MCFVRQTGVCYAEKILALCLMCENFYSMNEELSQQRVDTDWGLALIPDGVCQNKTHLPNPSPLFVIQAKIPLPAERSKRAIEIRHAKVQMAICCWCLGQIVKETDQTIIGAFGGLVVPPHGKGNGNGKD